MDLQLQVSYPFEKLHEKYQEGVVYIWLVLEKIVNITNDVVALLDAKTKDFSSKGLLGFVGEHLETIRVEQRLYATRTNNDTRTYTI